MLSILNNIDLIQIGKSRWQTKANYKNIVSGVFLQKVWETLEKEET